MKTVGIATLVGASMLACVAPSPAADVIRLELEVTVPPETPLDATVEVELRAEYSSASTGPRQVAWVRALEPGRDRAYTGEVRLESPARLEFRFRRGSGRALECDPSGAPSRWRRLRVNGDLALELRVARWCDLGPRRTMGPTVTEHSIEDILGGRRTWVYLPPSYAASARSYPVLYMLDGQNLFDESTSFVGEWHVDEICDELIARGEIEELVVVGVDNAGEQRVYEYTPWPDPQRGEGGGGEHHLRLILDELVPWIESQYRIRSGPASAGFAGSSLGGLMALYVAREHGEQFGRIAALSPSLWWAQERVLEDWPAPSVHMRLWADMGTAERGRTGLGRAGVGDAILRLRQLRQQLRAVGYVEPDRLRVVEVDGGEHNEAAWSARLPDVLRFLFPPTPGESQ